jgi:putative hydrolase of the HAD superfamily
MKAAYSMSTRVWVFDFGGVLMKTTTQAPRWQWDDRLGLARGTVERVVHGSQAWRAAQHGTLSEEAYWADVGRQLGLDNAATATLAADYFSADQLDLDLISLIRDRRAAGQRVALLSNDAPSLRHRLRQLGIDTLFDPLIISGDIGVMKPDPAAYHAVLDALGIPATQTVFIDDMPANIAGAQAVGMHAIHYTAGLNLKEALAALER